MPGDAETEQALLSLIGGLVAEVNPEAETRLAPDSSLTQDIGLDSLARVELLLRIRRRFGVDLEDRLALDAMTPRDLLRAILSAHPKSPAAGPGDGRSQALRLSPAVSAPAELGTLTRVLRWHARQHPDRPHIHLLEDGEHAAEPITYAGLLAAAEGVAEGLSGRNPGSRAAVGIMLPTSRDYFAAFFGVLLAGGIPVPLYPPFSPDRLAEHLRRQAKILDNSLCRLLLIATELSPMKPLLKAQVPSLEGVYTLPEVAVQAGSTATWPEGSPEDIALLQYTSGSTGDPKGVALSHGNILANIRAMGQATRAGPEDVFVSWLPLYHDMGLIGAWLGSLTFAIPLVIMPPTAFLARPSRWLRAIHRFGGTLSAAPNFAYGICAERVGDEDLAGLDLGAWRRAFNGAEPVSVRTLEAFIRRYSPLGFRPEAMAPVYGLAESSVGLAFSPLGRPPRIDRLRRGPYERDGLALPAEPSDADTLALASSGLPLPGHAIRVVDPAGRELPERRLGRIQFQGPSATLGYFRNPGATRRLFSDGWLETGDLGYMSAGELFVSGRTKEILIRAGRHFFPYEIEEAVATVPGVRKGGVVAFGSAEEGADAERLVVVAETRRTRPDLRDALRRAVAEKTAALGLQAEEILLVPPRSIPKTPSGKLRRSACRELYRRGKLGEKRTLRMQIAIEIARSLRPRLRRTLQGLAELLFAARFWLLFGLFAPAAWLAAMLPGGNPAGRLRRAAWAFFRMAGIRLQAEGIDRLPPGALVLVANHASWLDGPLLAALLPARFGIVAKSELGRNPLLRIPLVRIGTRFVERFIPERSAEDAEHLTALLSAGSALVFFPEGTVRRSAGIHPFRMGAFLAAARAGVPVIPVAIQGSRTVLRGGQWLPRRGSVNLTVVGRLDPQASGWDAALGLEKECRRRIAEALGEPRVD